MDLSWCPVCDRRTFALENLYCSEACRRKDELNLSLTGPSSMSNSFYEFPRRASQKPHQSPYNTPTCSPISTPNVTPLNSPRLSSSKKNSMYCYSDYYYAIRSVPSLEEEAFMNHRRHYQGSHNYHRRVISVSDYDTNTGTNNTFGS